MLLPDIAHVQSPLDMDVSHPHSGLANFSLPLLLHLAAQAVHQIEIQLVQRQKTGFNIVAAQIGDQHAIGRKMPWRIGNDHFGHLQFPRHQDRMQGTGATKGDHWKLTGVQSALCGHPFDHR